MRAWALRAGFVLFAALWALSVAPASSGDDTRWSPIGGVVADRGDGWHIHTQGHSNKHLLSAACEGRYLSVKHTQGAAVPMWSVDVDERLRAWDITAGVSATRDEARIFFDIDGRPISCWHAAFKEAWANIWLSGNIELEVNP
jgi:hypothetical protein